MKKILLAVLLIIFITGCNNPKVTLNVNDLTQMKYNDFYIDQDDYSSVINTINKINFNDKKINGEFNNHLTIKTNDELYNFSISTNNYLEYKKNNTVLYSTDQVNIKELVDNLHNLNEKYTKSNFYIVNYDNTYESKADDLLIKLDNVSNFIIITFNENVYNFKINTVDFTNNLFEDTNLLYSLNKINSNQKIVIRKKIDESASNIRISFENPYNYIVSIIPVYKPETNTIDYISEFKPKQNP